MIRFAPHTCFCIVDIPTDPYDESKATFVKQCRTHTRPSQVFSHNRSIKFTPPETRDQYRERRALVKSKPEFSRRT